MAVDRSLPRHSCQAIIEGVRCIRDSPVAEFKIVVGNTAIGIALCESCKDALAEDHPNWKFTQLSDFQ